MHQAAQGNYAFRYDPVKKELTYTSFHGRKIVFPVEFPYGQELVDLAVTAGEEGSPWTERKAVAWRIEDCGNAFRIKCMVNLPEQEEPDFSKGAIGLDQNYDLLALAETDASGNLIDHWILSFRIAGLSSGQVDQELSRVTAKAIDICKEKGKPLVREDIGKIKDDFLYNNKKRNRRVSLFAHAKISFYLDTKAYRAGVPVKVVNPAYTSVIGKMKYMRKFGLAIHEAAAFVIARRGMGLKDRIFKTMRHLIPKDREGRHHWAHWSYLKTLLKDLRVSDFYRFIRYIDMKPVEKKKTGRKKSKAKDPSGSDPQTSP